MTRIQQKKINRALSDTVLNLITASTCHEFLYSIYGNEISSEPFKSIESAFTGNKDIEEGFAKFINELFKLLTPHRNSLGEFVFSNDEQDIIQLLTKLLLLQILIPYMSDNALKNFKIQLSWGINIKGEKHQPEYLIYSVDMELKKRGIIPQNSHI